MAAGGGVSRLATGANLTAMTSTSLPIYLCTDFGATAPYLGQMEAVLAAMAPQSARIRMHNELPRFDPRRAAYLLPAIALDTPPGIWLAIVDPGVGSARRPLLLNADDNWWLGPDNGLLEIVARRAARAEWFELLWRPERLSASFHGRDLFAPAAAMLARGEMPQNQPIAPPAQAADWPDDLAEIVDLDSYGNAISGLRASCVGEGTILVAGERLPRARTFNDLPPGSAFWYENSLGVVEIAVNCGSAAATLHLGIGSAIGISGG